MKKQTEIEKLKKRIRELTLHNKAHIRNKKLQVKRNKIHRTKSREVYKEMINRGKEIALLINRINMVRENLPISFLTMVQPVIDVYETRCTQGDCRSDCRGDSQADTI